MWLTDKASEVTSERLTSLYAYPPGGAYVRANMVASIDGAAGLEGRSGGLGGPGDRKIFSLLRACADVVVVDDIGLLPVSHDAAEGLYRLVDAAYEKRSIAVSSNLHPAGFDELMPKTLATATVDRLLHHAHVCQTNGDSVRLTQALSGKGVNPLQ